jgi:putative sterol carrier protein
MADEITIEELMNRMPKAFLPDKAEGVGDDKCVVERGTTEDATMTLQADSQDYKDIILGKLDPMTAFMQQKVKLTGNLNMALGLTKYFKMR